MDFGKAPEPGTIALIVVTALIGVLMGVFGKAAAEGLLNLIVRPARFVKEALYSWVAPRNPLSISLRSYKRHVSRSNLTRIENPVGPNLEVPLEHAFAPLRLISGATEESVDLFAQAATSHRCIVLGGPGTGKTTLMKSLVTSVIRGRAREDALRDLIPVFVVLRNLAKREHTVEQAVIAAFADYHFPGAARFVESALEQGKLLVILDGLDEVGASRDFVAEQIRKFCEYDDQRAHRNRLLVTCREHSYRTRDLHGVIPEVVRVEPFANHHMRVFLQGWPAYKGRTAMKLYGLIQEDPQIRDICRNPLLLTILTGLYLDTDTFELPSSRERFYKDAVDELLVHRPARRHVKQAFDAGDKRQILERVALDRLETAERHEDPEEFTREVIRLKAAEVLRHNEFDPRDLIKELVEVNGIIKPGDEDSYTCAHRTIQEYFAAREARRKRKPEEVVEHFGARPEFIEVLYFYCGLVDNLPALAYVVNTLVSQQRWLEAGRCILYMKEPSDRALVERVAQALYTRVSLSVEYKAALEVLSSLARRSAPEFDFARYCLEQTIDRLADSYDESGASALESALATSPEAAMRVIPGLLKHRSPRWKEAAVQLLRDIGTGEALDRLVLLLNDPNLVVKTHAGRALAEMLKSRPHDLRARAALLPPRTDATIWPLEQYFPGRLAIPIAESLGDAETKSEALNYAARALYARGGKGDRVFLKHWRRIPRDLKLRRYRRRAARALVLCGWALALACFLVKITLGTWAYFTDRVFVLTLSPVRVLSTERGWLYDFRGQAKAVTDDIARRLPPNASGLARALPWNWTVEPTLPPEQHKAFVKVRNWAEVTPALDMLPDSLPELRGLTADEEVVKMESTLKTCKQRLLSFHGMSYLDVNEPELSSILLPLVAIVMALFFGMTSLNEASGERLFNNAKPRLRLADFLTTLVLDKPRSLVPKVFFLFMLGLGTLSRGSNAPLLLFFIFMFGGWLLMKLNWPVNPLSRAVDDVAPPEQGAERPKEQEPS